MPNHLLLSSLLHYKDEKSYEVLTKNTSNQVARFQSSPVFAWNSIHPDFISKSINSIFLTASCLASRPKSPLHLKQGLPALSFVLQTFRAWSSPCKWNCIYTISSITLHETSQRCILMLKYRKYRSSSNIKSTEKLFLSTQKNIPWIQVLSVFLTLLHHQDINCVKG